MLGTLVLNFATNVWPLDKIYNVATLNINPANLSGLVATNPATYTTGYPPTYGDPSKNPVNVDITSRGFTNFTAAEDLPAFMQNNAIFDIHGNVNICGAFYSPSFIEIENLYNNQTQYIRGSLIGGGGIYVQNRQTSTSIFSSESRRLAITACSAHSLALKSDGKVIVWGNQTDVPSDLINVAAIAAGDSYSLALAGDGPPPLAAPLTNPTWTTNGFSISLPTQSGRVYRLEYVSSLADTNWTALPLAAGNGATLTLTDSTATNSPQRFYRVRRW